MQKSTYIAAIQDKLHIQVFLLIKPATYQSRVVCLFLQSLPTLCLWGSVYESPETPKEVFSLLKKHIWPPTYDHWNHNFSTLQWYRSYIHSVETLFRILTFPWARRKWQPTPVFLPGKSHGQRAGYSPWGRKESDTTRATKFAGLVTCGMLPCPDMGSGGEPQLAVSHTTTSINNWYTNNHSVSHFEYCIQ